MINAHKNPVVFLFHAHDRVYAAKHLTLRDRMEACDIIHAAIRRCQEQRWGQTAKEAR